MNLEFRPCVGSGFCCKQAPCPFGSAKPNSTECVHLERREGDELGRYRCAIYERIVPHPLASIAPAFGSGCSSPLFNVDRDRIVRALTRKAKT